MTEYREFGDGPAVAFYGPPVETAKFSGGFFAAVKKFFAPDVRKPVAA